MQHRRKTSWAHPPDPRAAGDRWITSSSGRLSTPRARRDEFPRSPVTAWEAVVTRQRTALPAQDVIQGPAQDRVHDRDPGDEGVEANGRLTSMTGAVLLVLLAVEGVTILRIITLLAFHVVIGMVLVPPVLVKIGSTTWRFARYYLGSPEYRRKGPPPPVLRLLGPFVVVLTLAVVGSGIALLLAPTSMRNELLLVHKATFVLWFAAMAVHVIGHFLEMAHLAPRDFYWRTRRQVRGAGVRQWLLVGAACIGILLAVVVAPKVGPWLTAGEPAHQTTGSHVAAVTVARDPRHPHSRS